MINTNMRHYTYFTLGAEDAYGQPQLSSEEIGTIKMSIETSTHQIQDNILYSNATFIGFTNDYVDDSYVVNYGNMKLKVLYVNSRGRFKEVFMSEYVN